MRSLSAVLGTAAIPVVYLLVREAVSARAGLIAAALVAFNPLLVWYSQEARSYALLVLLAALSLLWLARFDRDRRPRDAVLWAVASALALATHYFALFVVAPAALWLLWRARGRAAAAAVGAVGVVGLALLPLAIDQSENPSSNFISGTGVGTRTLQVPKQLLIGYDAPAEVAITIAAALLAAAGGWLALACTSGRARAAVGVALGLIAVIVAVPVVMALLGADLVLARNLIVAAVPLVAVLGAGFAAHRAGPALAAALCVLSLVTVVAVYTRPEFQRDDWRGAAEALGPAAMERAIVVNPVAGAVPLQVYLDDAPHFRGVRPVGEIDVVAVTDRRPGDTPRPPRPPTRLAAGFALERREEANSFTLVVMRAPQPVPVDDGALNGVRLHPGLAATLIQAPAGR